jgi:hypothetical protein
MRDTKPQIRRPNGYEIRNAEGLYWDDRVGWTTIGMRWGGYRRRDMLAKARKVGGKLVRLTLVRQSRTGRAAILCPECSVLAQENARLVLELDRLRVRVTELERA